MARAAIPLLRASGRDAIVNVASEAALRGSAAGAAYTASEHAVAGLTKSTALMHAADGIRTNAVAPGATATAEQVAAVIAFLASDDASNVNGVIMPSDGGWSAV
ncbi:Levodione reductase [Kocuria rosea]|nr:SDR family oxidoreductase [Kocuria rosea]MEB2525630.1 SDR family oxidoreductase [Kocuria rosea]MEB2619736.1 SDR family oxidoreductase [Kocuria rosea]VEH44205.1 Levodione reductase [Kocuria rosea]